MIRQGQVAPVEFPVTASQTVKDSVSPCFPVAIVAGPVVRFKAVAVAVVDFFDPEAVLSLTEQRC
jgi:hypothetical protein